MSVLNGIGWGFGLVIGVVLACALLRGIVEIIERVWYP